MKIEEISSPLLIHILRAVGGSLTEATFDIYAEVSGLHQVTMVAVGINGGSIGASWAVSTVVGGGLFCL